MNIWTIKHQKTPGNEPHNTKGTEHVEDRLPANKITKVARGWHGDHCPKGSPSVGERSEPENVESDPGSNDDYPRSYLLLSWGADHLANMASMAGKVTPSPSPSMILTAYSRYRWVWAARGVNRVKTAVIRIP